MARVDAGRAEQVEAGRHALRRQLDARRCRGGLALHRLGARHVAADARPQRHDLALLGDTAAREGEAPRDLGRFAVGLQWNADLAGREEFDGNAHRQRKRGVGAAVGRAARDDAERVVGEGQDRAAMDAAGIVRVAGFGRQDTMHGAGLPGVALDAEIEGAGVILERIGRHEDLVAAEIDGIGH